MSVNNVGSKENPADLILRGLSAKELLNKQFWWEGPQRLCCNNLSESQPKMMEYDESQLEKNNKAKMVVAISSQ